MNCQGRQGVFEGRERRDRGVRGDMESGKRRGQDEGQDDDSKKNILNEKLHVTF